MSLAADPRSARDARRFVERTFQRWQCAHLLELATLLTSELVTNGILHARSDIELLLRLNGQTVRVEVRDEGRGTPVRREVGLESTNGRGLALVETLAGRWGVEPIDPGTGRGKAVWFELAT